MSERTDALYPTMLAPAATPAATPAPATSEQRAEVLYKPTILPRAAEVLSVDNGGASLARTAEFSRLAADAGLDTNDIDVFATVRAELEIDPPTPERAAEMRRKTREHLVETYGEERANKGIRAAQAMAKRDPRLREFLNKTGAGDDYRIAARLVRQALSQQEAGKLK